MIEQPGVICIEMKFYIHIFCSNLAKESIIYYQCDTYISLICFVFNDPCSYVGTGLV